MTVRRARWQVFGGAVVVVAGIAAFIEAQSHHPVYYNQATEGSVRIYFGSAGALPQTAYDLLRIGGWALLIFGVLLVVVGLIGYWGARARATPDA